MSPWYVLCEVNQMRGGTPGVLQAGLEHALERARALGALRLEWEADPNAVPFYLHMGGLVTGDVETSMGRRIPTMAIGLGAD